MTSNGGKNLDNARLPQELLAFAIGGRYYYRGLLPRRGGHRVDIGSAMVADTRLARHWTVTPGSMISFSLDVAGGGTANYENIAFYWGEGCQNNVLEGIGTMGVPGCPNPQHWDQGEEGRHGFDETRENRKRYL